MSDPALHEKASDDLAFIRSVMERPVRFTAVPGWGGVAMGMCALVAAPIAHAVEDPVVWLTIWTVAAIMAGAIGAWSLSRKARGAEASLVRGPGRRFIVALAPPVTAGAVLTAVFAQAELWDAIPGLWLVSYGVTVLTAGAFSVRSVPVMGTICFVVGCIAFLLPPEWQDAVMAIGFGGLHVGFGTYIARKYGG